MRQVLLDYDHQELVENSIDEICKEIRAVCDYSINTDHLNNPESMDWVWTFCRYASWTVLPIIRKMG